MQLSRVSFISFSISLISLLANPVQAAWEESRVGPPSCSTSNRVGCELPLNASSEPQIKDGYLGINNNLQVVGSANYLFVDGKLGVGPFFGGNYNFPIDPTALLDIDGQIRVRGPFAGPNMPQNAKVLSADDNGLVSWISDPFPIDQILPGFGISASSLVSGIVAIDTDVVQKTLPNTTCDFKSAVYSIDQNSLTINCRPFVTSVSLALPPNGLTLSGANGARSLSVNLTGGLAFDISNNITVTDTSSSGTGLKSDGTNLRFDNYNCNGTALYWQSTGPGTWTCNSRPAEPPGGSVLFLTSVSSGTPLPCPTIPDVWTDLGTHLEYSGGATTNDVRKCYQSTKSCQVLYLKHNSVLNIPSCPSGWVATPPTGSQYVEYVNGLSHFSRACTLCH